MPINPAIDLREECDASYSITFYNRNGQSIDAPAGISSLTWGRRLDEMSAASINYVMPDESCCQLLGNLEPFAHEVAIHRNRRLAWYGWILRVEYGRDTVSVDARDGLLWLKRRVLHSDIELTADVADHFQAVWDSAMLPDPIENITVVTTPTGVVESRKALISDHRSAWSIAREMMDSALDVTVFGKTILAGRISNNRPLELKLSEIEGDPRVVKDGTLYANRVIYDAHDQVVGIYPPGPAGALDSYPLVETIIKDSQVQDQVSAEAAARSRYEFSRTVPRLVNVRDAINLSPYTSLALEDLIPGSLINLDTTGLCYASRESFRLGDLGVSVAGGNERVTVSLQPTGPATTIDSSEDAVL